MESNNKIALSTNFKFISTYQQFIIGELLILKTTDREQSEFREKL